MTLKRYFWWKGMARQVADYCSQCIRCKYETPKLGPKAILRCRYKPRYPNEIISIDIIGPYPRSNTGKQYVLTIQCEFSKYVCAVPLLNKTAVAVTRAVTEIWLLVFGSPKWIRSDEGTDTDSAIIQYLCKMKQIKKIRMPVYSPHANPVERFHRTMNQALRMWIGRTQIRSWDSILPNIIAAYNNFVHSATKFTPSRLFFGREVHPPDIPIIPEDHPALSKYEYLEMTRRAQHIACLIARTNQKRADTSPQQKSPKTGKEETFELGELIQVHNLAPKHKLESKWDKIFVITRIAPNAIHCVRWRLDLHPPYRLRQQPKEMGQIEERLVHPKDVKKWNSELPPYHIWDEELVNQLLNPVHDENLIEDHENTIDTSTASDVCRPQASTHSSSTLWNDRRKSRGSITWIKTLI